MPVAIITGASRGLGYALAEGLAGAGWSLVLDGRGGTALAEARRALGDSTTVVAIRGSITDPEHRSALLTAARELGGPDLLVNNAGVLGPSPLPTLAELSLSAYRDVLEVGVVAPLGLTQLALPDLRARGGAVLNITSDAAIENYEGWGAYGSAKAALDQWSNVLAAEEPAVSVWWVDPGDLRTRMHQEAFPDEDISDRPLPATAVPGFLHLLDERPPSGRYRVSELLAPAGQVPA